MQEAGLESASEERQLAADRILHELRTQIVSGSRPGGSVVNERELSEEFGVSRLPVRSAIRRLALEGLIDNRLNFRAVVHTMTQSDIIDISELHAVLDRFAVRQAALRRTDDDLRAFDEDIERARTAAARGDTSELLEAGIAFREHAYQATRNKPLLDIYDMLRSRTRRMFLMSSRDLVTPVALYERLGVAFRDADPEAAEGSLRELVAHLRRTREEAILRRIESQLPDEEVRLPAVEEIEQDSASPAPAPEFLDAFETVRMQIIRGERKPGDTISERTLVPEFGISRTPARQAIEWLAHEGLVTLGGSRVSTRVRGLEPGEADDLYDVCVTLDLLAVKLAAQRPTRAEIRELSRLLVAEQSADPITEKHERLDRMFDFRRQVLRMSANQCLIAVDRVIESRMRMLVSLAPLDATLIHGHEYLYAAIVHRDTEFSESVYRSIFTRPEVVDNVLGTSPSRRSDEGPGARP